IVPRLTPLGASAAIPAAEVTPSEEGLQRFFAKTRRRYSCRRSLSLAHKTLLLDSPAEIGPHGAPRPPAPSPREDPAWVHHEHPAPAHVPAHQDLPTGSPRRWRGRRQRATAPAREATHPAEARLREPQRAETAGG